MPNNDIPLDINQSIDAGQSADEVVVVEVQNPEDEMLTEAMVTRLASLVEERFDTAERGRKEEEKRWLEAYHNYRGVYNKGIKFKENEKSKVFVKVTKTKVLAAYGQLIDVIFSGTKFPLQIAETDVPEGIAKYAHLNPLKGQVGDELSDVVPTIEGTAPEAAATPDNFGNLQQEEEVNPFDVGYEGDGNVLKPGARQTEEGTNFLGGLEEDYLNEEGEQVLTDGHAPTPEMQTQISPAAIAARRMERLIHDQIEASNGATELRDAIFECVLLGTGIIKGPFNETKTLHKWTTNEETDSRTYKPEHVKVPKLEFVSAWDFYPDPNATVMEDAEWAIHRHKLNRSQLRGLKDRPFFDKAKIAECLKQGYNYQKRSYEDEIKLDNNANSLDGDRFEVLEYWGIVDAEFAREAGLSIEEGIEDLEELQVNVWTCMGKVLRIVTNPFTPMRLPYHSFPYEKNPYSFWGVGVPENMEDSQQIMNGHARMAIDNLALAGSLVFDIDEAALVGGQSMDIFPGKVFKRQAGMPGQSVYGLKFPNTAPENMQMFDRFRQLADESTGIPSYSHGNTGVTGMTRTASGMSMLMGAASLNIKTVVKNLDDFLLKPLGVAFYQWNMQFYEGDLNVEGDLEIKATGTSSMMQKEVRSQRLTTFLQSVQNPAVAPFVKVSKIIQELAYSLDFDPEEIINSPEEAAIYAEIIGKQNAAGAGTPGQEPPLGPGGAIPPEGAGQGVTGSGNGTVGTGNVPQPGEVGFSGAAAEPTQ